MNNKPLSVVMCILISTLFLSACNLPSKPTAQAQPHTSPAANTLALTAIPARLCNNSFFPNREGASWEYAGSNTVLGAYTRTDTITASTADAFTLETRSTGGTYAVNFACTSAGLAAADPIQQYAGAILSNPDMPVHVKLVGLEGVSLPAKISPGDAWQQSADWEASSPDLNLKGRFIFEYTALDYENITVPYGTFDALRIDVTIRIQLSSLHIPAGSYTISQWMAPGVGTIKSQGASHVPRVEFSDTMELTHFVSPP